jgi:hypothetical protein
LANQIKDEMIFNLIASSSLLPFIKIVFGNFPNQSDLKIVISYLKILVGA